MKVSNIYAFDILIMFNKFQPKDNGSGYVTNVSIHYYVVFPHLIFEQQTLNYNQAQSQAQHTRQTQNSSSDDSDECFATEKPSPKKKATAFIYNPPYKQGKFEV